MPFDKFGMLIREEKEEPEEKEEVWVTKYYFCIDDGEHNERCEPEFTDLEEAKKCYEEEEKEAMEDPEKYFVENGCGSSKEDWTEDFHPGIALEEWTVLMKEGEEEDQDFVGYIDSWSPDLDELEEDESAKKEK